MIPAVRRRALATSLAAAIMSAGCLAAGCGASGSISAAASKGASALASRSASFSPADRASGAPSSRPGGPVAASLAAIAPSDSVPPSSAPPPATSAAPTSAPPTSAPPSSAAPTPASSAPSAQPSASSPAPAASTSPPASLWLWVLAGVIALAGLITWIIYTSRRSARKREWRSRAVDAYAKGSALADAIRIAERSQAGTTPDGAARWADIQRRMDDLGQTLYGLRATAPGGRQRARVEDVLAGLQAVYSEMAAGRAPAAGGRREPWTRKQDRLNGVEGRLRFFQDSLRELRDGDHLY